MIPRSTPFTASPSTITVGESTTLSWTTTNATSVRIPGTTGALAVDGSTSVTPSTTPTTAYTLTASGATGTTPDDDTVTINVKPRIDSFRADATTITRGNSTTLRWSTTGATSVTLDDTAVALDGNQTVSPTSDTTYELEASNSAGSNTRTVTITVRPPDPNDPEIDSFRASPSTITLGESTTLRWTTTDATSVRIPGTTGALAVDGSTSVTPTTTPTTAYTLTARGATGTTPDTDTVTINVKPRIDSFSASSTTITLGDQIRLRWSTTGATSVTLNDTAVALDGNQTVSPTSDTTYELEASNSAGSNTRTVTVTVNLPPCVIDSFTASPGTITRGGSSTLSWTTTNATSVSIPGTSGTLAVDGSVSVSPTATTPYTLTASGSDCTPDATDTATVTVVDPPVIDTFTATKTTITEGSSTTLRWTTTGATSVTLNETAVALDGSRSVSPTVDTTYTLKASNSADTPATDTATVSITVSPRPPTASLSVDPEEIFNPGDSATLTWSTSDATSAEIDEGVGSVTPVADGSTTVYPDTTTTYTLTATGPGGTATDTATVYTVDFQRTLTATLTADPLSITRGGSTTLSWATEGADSASIDQGVGAVTPVEGGSVSVSPTATTTYTLTATSGEGDDAVSTSASVEVTVTQPDPTIDSFSVDDATPETGETVTLSWTTSHATSAVLQRQSGDTWESVGTVALNGSHSVSRDSAGSESYQLLISRDNVAVLSAPITITWSDPPAD